jgi:hypothetical protein
MNRGLILLIMIASCAVFTSCSTSDNVSNAIVGLQTNEIINIAPLSDTLQHDLLGTGTFTYNVDSIIKANTKNKLGLSNVENLQVIACTITIQNPDTADNFANFQASQVSFYTNSNSTPVTIGTVTNNPDMYAPALSVPLNNNPNLKNYISPVGPTTFTYSIGGKARRTTNIALNVLLHVEYHISVKP